MGKSILPLNGGFLKQFADAGLAFTTSPGGKTYGGDLRWEAPLKGLILGSSTDVQAMDGSAPGGNLHLIPIYPNRSVRPVHQKEDSTSRGEYDRAPATAILTIGTAAIPVPLDVRSWFAMGSYRLWKKVKVGSYYSHYVNKGLDTTQPANYSKDWVASGRYDFNSYFYAKVEGHFLQGTGSATTRAPNPNGLKPDSNMLAAKIGFSF